MVSLKLLITKRQKGIEQIKGNFSKLLEDINETSLSLIKTGIARFFFDFNHYQVKINFFMENIY